MSEAEQKSQQVNEAFEQARALQAQGRLQEAEDIYGRILRYVPVHAQSLQMLGSIAYQKGDEMQAEAYLDRAIEIFQEILKQFPDSPQARAPLANLLLARGRQAEAEEQLRELRIAVNPIRASHEEFVRRREAARARGLPPMVINTVPKSASESIWNQLAEGLGLPQCYVSLGLFPRCTLVPHRVAFLADGGLITKEHIGATPFNLEVLQAAGIDRLVFHMRDPRQVALSWAHFVHDDVAMRLMAPIWRQTVPAKSVLDGGLEAVIDWSIDNYIPLLMDFVAGWAAIAEDKTHPLKVRFLTFEAFIADPAAYRKEVLDFYEIPPSSFAPTGDAETVHLRKGEAEEWREVFSPEQKKRAWAAMPKSLRDLCGWAK